MNHIDIIDKRNRKQSPSRDWMRPPSNVLSCKTNLNNWQPKTIDFIELAQEFISELFFFAKNSKVCIFLAGKKRKSSVEKQWLIIDLMH